MFGHDAGPKPLLLSATSATGKIPAGPDSMPNQWEPSAETNLNGKAFSAIFFLSTLIN
jgi:hypothetical protein